MAEFRVWCPDTGEEENDATITEAWDAEEAAENWAEEDDCASAEYDIAAQKETPVVCVRDLSTGKVTHWKVRGETVPAYYASEVPNPPEAP